MNIPEWQPPLKPGEITESRLIRAIMDGTFPTNSFLPGERELAALLGVTRPTLREAMQRLERDGWLEIHHGKPTRVCDFLKEGYLGISTCLAQYQNPLPEGLMVNLLTIRKLLAPEYTRLAVEKAPQEISLFLSNAAALPDTAKAFSDYEWQLHWTLTVHSGSFLFTHFLNNVRRLFEIMGISYFQHAKTRQHSRGFYSRLLEYSREKNSQAAGEMMEQIMSESCEFWTDLVEPGLKKAME